MLSSVNTSLTTQAIITADKKVNDTKNNQVAQNNESNKVQGIKKAIEEGNYKLDMEKTAKAMLNQLV